MIYFLILGFIFLLVYGLFFIYWPSKQSTFVVSGNQNIYTFTPEFGFIFFIFSMISFLVGFAILKKQKSNEPIALLVSISLVVSWLAFVLSQFLTPIFEIIRPDIKSPIGFEIPGYTINLKFGSFDLSIPNIPYLHILLVVGIIGILLFYHSYDDMITQIKTYFHLANQYFTQEYRISLVLSTGIFFIVFLIFDFFSLANLYISNGTLLQQAMGVFNSILNLINPLTNLLSLQSFLSPSKSIGIYKNVDPIIIIISSAIIATIIFSIISLYAIRRQYHGIDKEKLNIRRNVIAFGFLVVVLLATGIDLLNLFFFTSIPAGESFYWLFRDIVSNSLFTGMIYLEISLGITLVYKILKFANFAQAELVTFGAYMAFIFGAIGQSIGTWQLFSFLGMLQWIPMFFTVAVIAFVMTALLAYVLDLILFKPLRNNNASPITLMIASFALGLSLRMVFQQIFSANPIAVSQYLVDINLNSIILRIVIIASVLFTTWIFQIILYNTKYGKIMRAVSDNEDLAKVTGVKVSRIHFLVWIIAGGFAGVAGLLFTSYPVGTPWIEPDIGFTLLLSAFAVAILGGIGSFEGVVLASLIVGFTENMGVIVLNQLGSLHLTFDIPTIGATPAGIPFITNFVAQLSFNTSYKVALSYVILILVLKVRPYGLLGEKPSGDR